MKITKNRREIIEKFDFTSTHDILSASKIVKDSSKEKFENQLGKKGVVRWWIF